MRMVIYLYWEIFLVMLILIARVMKIFMMVEVTMTSFYQNTIQTAPMYGQKKLMKI